MKRIHLILVLVIGILVVSMYCIPTDSACGEDAQTAFKPFLGKWEGEWSFVYVNTPATRPCKLVVYLDNGHGFVDYHLGPLQTSNVGNKRNIVTNEDQQNKLKAEVNDINGSPCLVFATAKGKQRWFLKNGKLLCEYSTAQGDYKGALSKVQ